MTRRRVLKYGAVLGAAVLAACHRHEINDASIGILRFGRAAFTVSNYCDEVINPNTYTYV